LQRAFPEAHRTGHSLGDGNRFIASSNLCCADDNVWLKPSSGYWEEPQWSLGSLPGPGQSVLITNQGWKAVAIGPQTSLNFSNSLNVDSITVASPMNSYNVLLMNYAGLQRPLTTGSLTVASNSAMTMLYSALNLNGNGGGMSMGGEFTQDENSIVTGQWCSIGSGVYNLNSGELALNYLTVGGPFGVFNHNGGTNKVGGAYLSPGGTYNLNGGYFAPVRLVVRYGTTFKQQGGAFNLSSIIAVDGDFFLSAGIINGATNGEMFVPGSTFLYLGYVPTPVYGAALQTGGTNIQSFLKLGIPTPMENIGTGYGPYDVCRNVPEYSGSYFLSNGNLCTSETAILASGSIEQMGGCHAIGGALTVQGSLITQRM
jgi:hypothetical protein